MMLRSLFTALAAAASVCVLVSPVLAQDSIKDALDAGARWMWANQNPDGGYGPFGKEARVENASDVGITALALYALAVHPRKYRPEDGPYVSAAVTYLLSKQQVDGGFYDPQDPVLKNYRTSVAILALTHLDRRRYAKAIQRAVEFTLGQQADESKGFRKDEHLDYGGIGRSGSLRRDISNTSYGGEALHEAGLSASSPVWRKLEVFVSRAQNAPKVDPLLKSKGIGTTGDFSFRYGPGATRGPAETLDDDGTRVFSGYGTMTYQGLKSLLYAQVSRDDPRVKGAFDWISKHFTVTENPGMATKGNPRAGLEGLFYYYHTMAKTLSVYGQPIITDGRGAKHNWARELSAHLVAIQHREGYWKNTSERWWENIATLDTAYAMIALSICRAELARQSRDASAPQDAPGKKAGGK